MGWSKCENTAQLDYFADIYGEKTTSVISSNLDFFLKSRRDLNMKNIYLNKYLIFMKEGGLSTSITKMPIKIFEDLSVLFSHYSLFFLFFYIKKILIKLPGVLFVKKNKYYNSLLERLLEISKK